MSVTMRQMLEAGVHFGHQTRYWNPKMAEYIFGQRNKIHIVNLEKTMQMYQEAMKYIRQLAANKGTILFVGTKRQARDIVAEEARRCGMPYVDSPLARRHADQLQDGQGVDQAPEGPRADGAGRHVREDEQARGADAAARDGQAQQEPRRHQGHERRCPTRCSSSTSATTRSRSPRRRSSASRSSRVVDTNHSPIGIAHVIPGNDDSSRAIRLYARGAADAILEGRSQVIQEIVQAGEEFVEVAGTKQA